MSIRETRPNDKRAFLDIAIASGLVPKEYEQFVGQMFDNHHSSKSESNEHWLVADVQGEVAGIAYAVPEEMAQGTWNLRMIAVSPSHRRRGLASILIHAIESRLEGQRLLLIDTSQTADQLAARKLYSKLGYKQQCVIPDFFEKGEDKVTFLKHLSSP